ncbi:MFS transporter [Conexibacter sp. SYSU D00693]|uniref:MFS transporter n=1 Tax=Conexibacter sp. SYSU D00693 TaxID=2812560 RepID=UPI00196B1142|nr:MFS transporter [Conexibacter sp. SYSU D00693]
MPAAPNTRTLLAIILGAYFMIILDVSVVVTALPSIDDALHFSDAALSWVQNAYTLTFGGLLLLGARMGDLLGRRRVFVAGIGLFTAASLVGGFAGSPEVLLAARAVQGVGAAIAAPATLAILMLNFPEGPERLRAVGLYGAVAGGGGSVGLVLGGLVTDVVSWRWGLWLNVPVGLALIAAIPRVIPETPRSTGRFDVAGALTATVGISALVYGFVRAAEDGWGEAGTVAAFVAGVLLTGAFLAIERRAEQPITPLHLFAHRQRAGAYLGRVLMVGGVFSSFFFLSQFLQGVRGFSALETGVAFLAQTLPLFLMSRTVPWWTARFGSFRVLVGGLAAGVVGMAWLSRVGADGSFLLEVALPLAVIGSGMGLAFIPITQAGLVEVPLQDAGAASGLVNVAHQVGGSLGLAVLVTVFTSADTLTEGVEHALTGSVLFLAAALVVAVTMLRPAREPAAVPAVVTARA